MIVIGSFAAAAHGLGMGRPVGDIDLIGSAGELHAFKERNHARILSQESIHGHRVRFTMKMESGHQKVEIDHEQSVSDRMLEELCDTSIDILGCTAKLPSPSLLYFTKRAHANVPLYYAKTIRDLIALKPHVGTHKAQDLVYYEHRKRECQERYNTNRQRFSLAISNSDFFNASNHVRFFEHDDIHEAVAHREGFPLYKRCKKDLSKAKIDKDLFEDLSPLEQLRMVQEEFMVIGLERFYIHDKNLDAAQAYQQGMHKTIRDLFVGYFQDFCIDHIDQLLAPPPFDFIQRFEDAVSAGRIRPLEKVKSQPGEAHAKIVRMIRESRFAEARVASEDMIRASDQANDPHAFFLLGLSLSGLGSFGGAIKSFRACVLRDPAHAGGWFRLGSLLRSAKQPKNALECLSKAQELNCTNPQLWIELGSVYAELGDQRQAEAIFRQALNVPRVKDQAQLQLQALGLKHRFTQDIQIHV